MLASSKTYVHTHTHNFIGGHCVVLKLGFKQMMENHFFAGIGIKKHSPVTLTAMT